MLIVLQALLLTHLVTLAIVVCLPARLVITLRVPYVKHVLWAMFISTVVVC